MFGDPANDPAVGALALVARVRSTVHVKRIGIGLVALVALALAGCGGDDPPATPAPATPTATVSPGAASPGAASPGPSASPSADAAVEFTVDGAGPYQLGADLTTLQATPGVGGVTNGAAPCPQTTTARGTGAWQEVELSFHADGVLYLAVNRSASIPTPSGAWVGSRLAELKSIYAGIPGENLARGTAKAYLVTTISGRGILFDLGSGARVVAMMAGESGYLKTSYLGGKGFC